MRPLLERKKRGNVQDIVFIVVILFALAIVLPVIAFNFREIASSVNASEDLTNSSRGTLNAAVDNAPKILNTTFVFIFFASFIGITIAAYLIESSAIFFFIAVILLSIFSFVGAVLSNVYQDQLDANPELQQLVDDNFVLMDFLMSNYVVFIVLLGLLIIFALYAKISGNVGSGV